MCLQSTSKGRRAAPTNHILGSSDIISAAAGEPPERTCVSSQAANDYLFPDFPRLPMIQRCSGGQATKSFTDLLSPGGQKIHQHGSSIVGPRICHQVVVCQKQNISSGGRSDLQKLEESPGGVSWRTSSDTVEAKEPGLCSLIVSGDQTGTGHSHRDQRPVWCQAIRNRGDLQVIFTPSSAL